MEKGSLKKQRRLTPLENIFLKSGFSGLSDEEAIELLLCLVLNRRRCRQLAIKCYERFNSLVGLLTALPAELEQVGLSSHSVLCIKLLHALPVEILKQKITEKPIHDSAEDIFNFLYYSMRDRKTEVFKVIYLNSRSEIIDTADLFEGTADNIPIRPREIIESAISHSAAGLIFVHNHPTGDPTPSRSDKQITRDLVFVGMILQIKVLDHIIIGANNYFSFADGGLIQKYEDNFLNLKIRGVLASVPLYQRYNQLPRRLHYQDRASMLPNIARHLTRK